MTSYLIGAVLGALAIQHIAYIIRYGSIFDTPRNWLKVRRYHRFWGWWAELVMCQLCTITQLSIWVWMLPVLVWGRVPLDLPLPVLVVVVWFSEAAMSLAAWDLMRFVGRGSDALVRRAQKDRR